VDLANEFADGGALLAGSSTPVPTACQRMPRGPSCDGPTGATPMVLAEGRIPDAQDGLRSVIGAVPHPRTETRLPQRNEHRAPTLMATAADPELRIPGRSHDEWQVSGNRYLSEGSKACMALRLTRPPPGPDGGAPHGAARKPADRIAMKTTCMCIDRSVSERDTASTSPKSLENQ